MQLTVCIVKDLDRFCYAAYSITMKCKDSQISELHCILSTHICPTVTNILTYFYLKIYCKNFKLFPQILHWIKNRLFFAFLVYEVSSKATSKISSLLLRTAWPLRILLTDCILYDLGMFLGLLRQHWINIGTRRSLS